MQYEVNHLVCAALTESIDAKLSQALGVCQLLNALPRGELPTHAANAIWAVVEILQSAQISMEPLLQEHLKCQTNMTTAARAC